MPASPTARSILEDDRQFTATPVASREILDRMSENEEVRVSGVARINTDLGYYIVTQRGIHYAYRKRAGLFRHREVSGFFDKADFDSVDVEAPSHLPHAYLRLLDKAEQRIGTIWFENEFCGSASGRAAQVAEELARE
jgi:hypothetical protein